MSGCVSACGAVAGECFQATEDHVLDSCEKEPCLVGSPSTPALAGFVGGVMGTAEALRVPSGGPMGIGAPCGPVSCSHYTRGGTGTTMGSIASNSTGGIWGLMRPCPCPGIRRLGDPDLSTIDSAGWLLR